MIFYFTGTGNSLDVAKRIKKDNEKIFNIADCIKNNTYSFKLNNDEKLGFVFPVYFYNIPIIVKEFINKLNIKNINYAYAIITCGGSIAQTSNVLSNQLLKKGIKLNYAKGLLMPDNAVIFYSIKSQIENNKLLESSYVELNTIIKDIDSKKETIFKGTIISDVCGLVYNLSLSTKKFYVQDSKCISCGLCEKICPSDVIVLKNNKPVWIKDKCVKCLACINRCPKQAVQYGKNTIARHRYKNPIL